MPRCVLDASALLCLLNQEPGAEQVDAAVAGGTAVIGAVSLSEVVAKLADAAVPEPAIREALVALGLDVISFDGELAIRAGLLRPHTGHAGVSPGGRACLALAQQEGVPALTADRAWTDLHLPGVEIQVIR